MARSVYLDYNATTPLAPEVLETINTTLRDAWGNPSSSHSAGRKARHCIDEARASVARMINVAPADIVFTSGGTESNNMVFDSVARHYTAHGYGVSGGGGAATPLRPHVITTNMEHDSVSLMVKHMEEKGLIDVTVVKADASTGMVRAQDFMDSICPSTVLISIMLANNETGVVQPVGEIVRTVRRYEKGTKRKQKIFLHTDAAQALGKVSVDAKGLDVDYLTVVGHKFYGPRVGALYVKGLDEGETPLYPMLYGGGQERGFRPGTENTGMITGLGKAAELVADNVDKYNSHMRSVRDYLEQKIEAQYGARAHFNGRLEGSTRIPNTCNVSLVGKELQGNRVLSFLEHCQASVGAACHSQATSKPSPILVAIGIPETIAINALRVSVGRETTHEEIDLFIQDLRTAVERLESNTVSP